MLREIFLLSLLCIIGIASSRHQLAVYWGQDSAGALRLNLEKEILKFCQDYDYDIIPIAFLNVFFDINNKDNYPGINLANHCNKTFKGYTSLLNCADIGQQIQQCQNKGKKILISLGGAAGLYYFTSSAQSTQFAHTVWKLFLDGTSDVRPFHNAVLDGIDLDIEGGTTAYYGDFVREIRLLMNTDTSKKFYISGAPQCPFPDVIMGPGSDSKVLGNIPQEFDYLFVQFYNNYCSFDNAGAFNSSIYSWFNFATETRSKFGKGPLIFIGLPAGPKAGHGYQTPEMVESTYNKVKSNENLGGIMLWDASYDENNIINGQHYSHLIQPFLLNAKTPEYEEEDVYIISCKVAGRKITFNYWHAIAIASAASILIVLFVRLSMRPHLNKMEANKKYFELQNP